MRALNYSMTKLMNACLEPGEIAQGGTTGPVMKSKKRSSLMIVPSTDLGEVHETVINVMSIILLEMNGLMMSILLLEMNGK